VKATHDSSKYVPPKAILDLCNADTKFTYSISVGRPGFKATPNILKHLHDKIGIAKAYLEKTEHLQSWEVQTPDNRNPRDLTITITKMETGDVPMPIPCFFPPRNDEQFAAWVSSRIVKARQKGATILMLNYVFRTPVGWNAEFRTDILRALPHAYVVNNELLLPWAASGSVAELVVFMPSGMFESIRLT
jgi:hypothetical protein